MTARIRRRNEPAPASELPAEASPIAHAPADTTPATAPVPDAATPAPHDEPPAAVIHRFPELPAAPGRPIPAYRQQVARGRKQKDFQLALF